MSEKDRSWSALEVEPDEDTPEAGEPSPSITSLKPQPDMFPDDLPRPTEDLPPTALAELDSLAGEFLKWSAEKDRATAEFGRITDTILRRTEGSGSFASKTIETEHHKIVLTIPETLSWDKAALAMAYGDVEAVPDHITQTFSVDKRKYDKLSIEEQAKLEYALTRKQGKAKLTVTRDV